MADKIGLLSLVVCHAFYACVHVPCLYLAVQLPGHSIKFMQ